MKTILAMLLTAILTSSAFAETTAPTPSPALENLNTALSEMIVGVTKTAGQAKDFLVAQTPDVVRQLLYWKAAESIVYNIIALALLILVLINFKKFYAYGKTCDWYEGNQILFGWTIITVVLSVIGTLAFFANLNMTWLQIWLAPKVYLIEYAKTLLGH